MHAESLLYGQLGAFYDIREREVELAMHGFTPE